MSEDLTYLDQCSDVARSHLHSARQAFSESAIATAIELGLGKELYDVTNAMHAALDKMSQLHNRINRAWDEN